MKEKDVATAAASVRDTRRQKLKRRYRPKFVVHHGSRVMEGDEAREWLAEWSARSQSLQERREMIEGLARRPGPGDSASIRFAMRAIEYRIVKGLWVLEISTEADGPREARRHGLGYMPDEIDHWAEAIAKGGWQPPAPRPAVPSSREIDAAREAKKWIEWLDEGQARLLTVAAMTKRGDHNRRVAWDRVKSRLRLPESTPHRTLQDRYDRALRWIVAELSVARVG